MKKILLLCMTLALACGLLIGGLGSALAEQSQNQYSRGIFGTVDNISIDADGNGTIVLSNLKPASDNTAAVQIKVTAATVYHIPTVTVLATGGVWQTWTALADESQSLVEEADRLAVLLTEPADDLTAQKIMVVPVKKLYRWRYQHRLGVVVDVEGGTATVAKRNGEQMKIALQEGVVVSEGQFVVLVTDRLSGDSQLRAVHAYRFQTLMDRFEGYLEGSLTKDDFEGVTERIQAAYARHIAALEQLKTKLEEQNREQAAARVEQAIRYCEARYAEVIQLRDQIRQRIQDAGGWDAWQDQWGVISGNITNIDTSSRLITIETDEGPIVLHVPFRAGIVQDDYPFAFRSLEVGDVVVKAIYHKGDVNQVVYLEIA